MKVETGILLLQTTNNPSSFFIMDKKQISLILIGSLVTILVIINFPFPPNVQVVNLQDSYSTGEKLHYSVIVDGCEDCSSHGKVESAATVAYCTANYEAKIGDTATC